MPTYEYSCRSCGAHFDAWQKITDDPIELCPTCGGSVHRIVFPVGLMFKGSGFYSTDSRGSAATPAASSPAATSGDAGEKKSSSAAPEAAATTPTTSGSSSSD